MVEEIDLEQIERNVLRDYCQDGVGDMALGVYMLLLGVLLVAGRVAPFIPLLILFFPLALRALKRRFTYPRTGYVKLRQGDPGPLPWLLFGSLALGLVALVAVLIAVGVIGDPAQWYRWMPIAFGIWLTGIFLGLALRVGLVRYYVVASLALVCGPTFALLPLARRLEGLGLLFVAVGAVLLAWGVIAFARFLRQHPEPVEDGGDDRW